MTTLATVSNRKTCKSSPNGPKTERYQSWGKYPKVAHRKVSKIYWRDQLEEALRNAEPESLLPYGMGRSYGDSCLNTDRDLLDCSALNRILDFDWTNGRVCVEAGITLGDLLEVIVPRGWFLPVVPGTKFVTVGGAIANDIHGKNHHRAGTFGCHVKQITLYRSDTSPVDCSPAINPDLLQATIGGLGLTGVIGSAEIQLKPIIGNTIQGETLIFRDLDQFLDLAAASDQTHEYTVGWIDSLSGGATRGVFFRGNHADKSVSRLSTKVRVPFAFPEFVLNRCSVSLFNCVYFRLKARKPSSELIHYDPFFFPLDWVLNWNFLYGRRGLVQYQCVLANADAGSVKRVIEIVSKSGEACFLAVLKAFGEIQSPGLLSFPRPGTTLALDLPMRGNRTLALLSQLDEFVLANGGAVYPGKDARMSSGMFKAGFPNWGKLVPYIDPKLSSSFWRRVTAE